MSQGKAMPVDSASGDSTAADPSSGAPEDPTPRGRLRGHRRLLMAAVVLAVGAVGIVLLVGRAQQEAAMQARLNFDAPAVPQQMLPSAAPLEGDDPNVDPVDASIAYSKTPAVPTVQQALTGGAAAAQEARNETARILARDGVSVPNLFRGQRQASDFTFFLPYLSEKGKEFFRQTVEATVRGDAQAADVLRLVVPFDLGPAGTTFVISDVRKPLREPRMTVPSGSATLVDGKPQVKMLATITQGFTVEENGSLWYYDLIRDVALTLSPAPAGTTVNGKPILWLIDGWSGTLTYRNQGPGHMMEVPEPVSDELLQNGPLPSPGTSSTSASASPSASAPSPTGAPTASAGPTGPATTR